MKKFTKIVATLGPASDSYTIIKRMVQAGMNVVRLNFSHGTHAEHAHLLQNVRNVSKDLNIPIAVMQDLQGPKIRVEELKTPYTVKRGDLITLTTSSQIKNAIPVQYKKLPMEVKPGASIFINDGMVELTVLRTNKKDRIECKVIAGGEIASRKGINVVGATLSAGVLSPKDKDDLKWGIAHHVDYVALSFVKSAKDIIAVKKYLKETGIKIIAKIERTEAVRPGVLDEIIKVSDAVMVARGDLGVEVGPEHVPILQKRIIHISNTYGKPVITATQMLTSMLENPVPTRAEVSDIANAILDHTDALMLSNETSVGAFPIKTIQVMSKIALTVEKEMAKYTLFNAYKKEDMPALSATACAGVQLTHDMNAHLIVILTETGESALEVTKYRLQKETVVITSNEQLRQQLSLAWGLHTILLAPHITRMTEKEILAFLKREHLSFKGQEIIVIDGRGTSQKIETMQL